MRSSSVLQTFQDLRRSLVETNTLFTFLERYNIVYTIQAETRDIHIMCECHDRMSRADSVISSAFEGRLFPTTGGIN